ncbi:hypothetical protein PGIGA_G00181850 [Pangasianodon gigas]|uniref:Uncharacterized protein n=1 Tax=Pangasianodon gigas TaxID=30993 RepID=A0ACC5XW39_PANGG|nr:hypothetical protein [Pangasianodon gigas]
MPNTTITCPRPQRPEEDEDKAQDHADRRKARSDAARKAMNDARMKLKPLWDLLNDPQASFDNLSDLLTKCNLSMDDYRNYAKALSTSSVILLKRDPKEAWVSGYNPDLLWAWNANMDIQYVLDPYSCIMYMLSYISKPEHEMNDFLKNVIKGVRETNINEEDEMKHIMQAYSKHRQVSAQESVARTCSLPMKKCSQSVVFLPTDDDALKMSLPLSVLQNKDPDSEDIWMSGIIDKYRTRPQTQEFEKMCLADFASNYRIVYGRQTEGKNVHRLLNNMGFIQKRTVGKAAIIRYARLSEEKQPEKFYGRLLKLYVPHRHNAQLKPQRYPTYQEFYKSAFVELPSHPGLLFPVRAIVKANQEKFEKHSKEVDEAFEQLQQEGPSENAWTAFAPEIEVDRLECITEGEDVNPDEENEQDDVPEYQIHHEDGDGVIPKMEAPQMSIEFVRKLYRSLNETQAAIFYTVRQWCQKRVWGQNPEQFFLLRIRNLKPPYQGLGNALDEVRAGLRNSRTTSLHGLHITDFNEKKIYADPEITVSLRNMKRAAFKEIMPLLQGIKETNTNQDKTQKIIHHNTEGLASHIEDIKCHHELQLADILCITETHLSGSCISHLQLEGYKMFARNRHITYSTYAEIAKKDGGGVAIFCKEDIQAQPRQYIHNVTDLEFVIIKIDTPTNATIATVYRPPHYSLEKFLPNLRSLLVYMDMKKNPVIICRDFNEDLLSSGRKAILELFQSKGYTQLITTATTDKHTLQDHIYISHPDVCLQSDQVCYNTDDDNLNTSICGWDQMCMALKTKAKTMLRTEAEK